MKKNLLLATSTFGENLDNSYIDKLKSSFNIYYNPYKRKMTKKELINILRKYNIQFVVAGLETYDSEVIEQSKLQIISRLGSGISNIDINFAKSKKIKIFSTPEAPAIAVAELTLSMMLNLLKHSFKMNNDMHNNNWKRSSGNLLAGKTVLIVGYGMIGKKLSLLLKPFNAKIILCDKRFKTNKSNKFKSLSKALPSADIITFHVDADKTILGIEECKFLKKGVLVLNSSRGKVVNEKVLIEYIKNKTIKGAWIDTFETEPYIGKLSKFENVILTPHIGSFTVETRSQMEIESVQNILESIRIK